MGSLEDEPWFEVEEDLFEEFGSVEDVGHWPRARVWWVGEIKLDVVADDTLVVTQSCLCDVPFPDGASGSQRHGRANESAVSRHIFRLRFGDDLLRNALVRS